MVVDAGPKQSLRQAIEEARGHSGYLLLTVGFFVCGFHVTFIATHFPAYLADNGVSMTAAAYALGVIGLFNVIGAYLFGALGDRFRKKNVLTLIYCLRAVVMVLILFIPINDVTGIIFGAALGIIWLATVPLTSGIVAQVFGPRHFSMLYGVVFMSHQIGGFTGAWLGGYIYDLTGSYDLMWAISVVLGLAAAGVQAAFDLLASHRPDIDRQRALDEWAKVNERLLGRLNAGKLTMAQVRDRRFRVLLKGLHAEDDDLAHELNEALAHVRLTNIRLFDDTLPTLKALRSR